MFKTFTLTAAAALTALTAIPAAADAHPRSRAQYHDNGNYAQSYRGQTRAYGNRNYTRCRSGTTGMIVGGAGGALLGREVVGRRSRSTGTILGAAAGALLGREATRDKRCR